MKDDLTARKHITPTNAGHFEQDVPPPWQQAFNLGTHALLMALALLVSAWAIPSSGRESAQATSSRLPAADGRDADSLETATFRTPVGEDPPGFVVPPHQQPTMVVTLPLETAQQRSAEWVARSKSDRVHTRDADEKASLALPGALPGAGAGEQVAWVEPGGEVSDSEAMLTTRPVPHQSLPNKSAIVEPTLTPADVQPGLRLPVEAMPEDTIGSGTPGWYYGLPAGARTVYVIDASGSLIDTLPFALMELRRAIASLTDDQAYAVLFFNGNGVMEAPPHGLVRAIDTAKNSTLEWLAPERLNIVAAGKADPLPALQRALSYQPDTVILLSDSITGLRDPWGDRKRLLEAISPSADVTRFHTIQFIDPDPTAAPGRVGTLELIAQATGGRHRHLRLDDARPILTPSR